MTTDERKEIAKKIFTDLELTMARLAARWQNEKAYESIRDYQAVLQKQLPPGATITKMFKRPFGFAYTLGDATYNVKFTASGKYYYEIVR